MTGPPSDRQTVAMGGGGFSEEPDNLPLDRYVLGLVRRNEPRTCFVPTASGDASGYACDDGVALHLVGDRLAWVVSSRPPARAYRLQRRDGDIEEQPLIPIFLGAPSGPPP